MSSQRDGKRKSPSAAGPSGSKVPKQQYNAQLLGKYFLFKVQKNGKRARKSNNDMWVCGSCGHNGSGSASHLANHLRKCSHPPPGAAAYLKIPEKSTMDSNHPFTPFNQKCFDGKGPVNIPIEESANSASNTDEEFEREMVALPPPASGEQEQPAATGATTQQNSTAPGASDPATHGSNNASRNTVSFRLAKPRWETPLS